MISALFQMLRRQLPRLLATGLLVASLAGTARAASWWDPGWTQRKKITVDPGASDPAGAVPVLLRLHDGNFPFAEAKEDGSDLRLVAADDKTPLSFHIEKFDALLNEAFVWVKIPGLKPGAKTEIWLYYGNPKAVPAADPKGTYDSGTALIWHFGEKGSPAADASGNGNSATAAGVPAEGALIAGGLRFDGKASVSLPTSPSLTWAAGAKLTWSLWIKPAVAARNATLFSRREGTAVFRVGLDSGVPFLEVNGQRSAGPKALEPGGWRHLSVVADGAAVSLLLDGEPCATLATVLPALAGPALLGADSLPGGTGFVGEVDELEISTTARTSGFLRLAFASEGGGEAAAKLLAFGEGEQPKDWLAFLKTGYIGVIISSLTVDGWVVIGVLGIMAIISWWVMIGKALYLRKVAQGNALFLAQWQHVANDLSVLDDADQARSFGGRLDPAAQRALRASSLYRVYHIGVEEMRSRHQADRSERVLSARSIQSIRASLDGGIVRESQRLNSQIVLLTIAISGGPFLGLLGTVVGVMITFAAVAQAGDVNVNAIAPGIAAALAATVAGLAVAIPALFGYNWLLTQIKSATADMQVFIDEFVTKMAEFYSETSARNLALTRAPFAPSDPRK